MAFLTYQFNVLRRGCNAIAPDSQTFPCILLEGTLRSALTRNKPPIVPVTCPDGRARIVTPTGGEWEGVPSILLNTLDDLKLRAETGWHNPFEGKPACPCGKGL